MGGERNAVGSTKPPSQRRQRASRRDHGTRVPPRDSTRSPSVISVFVRQYDTYQRRQVYTRPLRSLGHGPRSKSSIQQQGNAGGGDDERVTPASRPQHHDVHVPVAVS